MSKHVLSVLCTVSALSSVLLTTSRTVGGDPNSDWGHLSGQFVFVGPVPARQPAKIDCDKAFCGKWDLRDESLIVDEDSRGVANVVVYLYVATGTPVPAIHSSFETMRSAKIELNNVKCRFDPHITLLRTTQSLVIAARDPIASNAQINPFVNSAVNIVIPSGTKSELRFPQAERVPQKVSCPVHAWEKGYILIKNHPYFAVTDENGRFKIQNLPVGEREFQVWHEEAGYVRTVRIGGRQHVWKKGRSRQTIEPGKNDLGIIELAAELFQ